MIMKRKREREKRGRGTVPHHWKNNLRRMASIYKHSGSRKGKNNIYLRKGGRRNFKGEKKKKRGIVTLPPKGGGGKKGKKRGSLPPSMHKGKGKVIIMWKKRKKGGIARVHMFWEKEEHTTPLFGLGEGNFCGGEERDFLGSRSRR